MQNIQAQGIPTEKCVVIVFDSQDKHVDFFLESFEGDRFIPDWVEAVIFYDLCTAKG